MPSTTLVAEATSSSSGSAFALAERASTSVEERGHAVGGGADAGERGLGGGEDGVEVGDELLLGRLVDQRPGRGEDGGELGGGVLDALLGHQPAGVGEQEAEVLRRLADALGGDERVDVGEERHRPVHHVLERQLGDALQHALGGGGDAGDVGGGARQHRVGLGVAVELGRRRRPAPWRGRRRGSGSAGPRRRAGRAGPARPGSPRRSSACSGASLVSVPVMPRRCGTSASVVRSVTRGGWPSSVITAACRDFTSPTLMPWYSTAAPGCRPRTEPSKSVSRIRRAAGSSSKRFWRAAVSEG